MQGTFDAQAVRSRFPALGRTHNGRKVAYFGGPGGSQVAIEAIEAMSRYMTGGGANLHGVFPTSVGTGALMAETRRAMVDFLGARPQEIVFGANMTTLTFALASALKTPTIAFRVEGRTPREVCESVLKEGFFVANGHFYASTLTERLGISDKGSFVRAGLAPYNTRQEVEGLVGALERVVGGR